VAADPLLYSSRWRVRPYELDANGHVNNAVYLNYAEALTIEHAEASGYGTGWTRSQGGAWLVHRSIVTHHRPAVYGDELELTVRVELVKGVRGVRRTDIHLLEGTPVAEVLTEWVWVGLDGKPKLVPAELVDIARPVTEATLARNPNFVRDLARRI
jgi:acyl-CoA thioester hydrolase